MSIVTVTCIGATIILMIIVLIVFFVVVRRRCKQPGGTSPTHRHDRDRRQGGHGRRQRSSRANPSAPDPYVVYGAPRSNGADPQLRVVGLRDQARSNPPSFKSVGTGPPPYAPTEDPPPAFSSVVDRRSNRSNWSTTENRNGQDHRSTDA